MIYMSKFGIICAKLFDNTQPTFSAVMPMTKLHLPKVIYEPLPYLMVCIGMGVIFVLDHPGVLTCGALLILIGFSMMTIRLRYRIRQKNLIVNARNRANTRIQVREEVAESLAKTKRAKAEAWPKTEVTPLN